MIEDDNDIRHIFADEEPISHPPDALLSAWITRIRNEEPSSESDGLARSIIRDFYLRNFLGIEQSRITLDWLADSLSEILDHKDPLRALGLMPRPKKRPPDPSKAMDVAMWVACAERIGLSHADAKRRAADTFHMDESNVAKLIRKGGALEWMNPDTNVLIKHFALLGKPLPDTAGNK